MSLFNDIKKILLGNGAAQLIQFAFLPLAAFIYTPEQFGVFGIIQAYSTAITIFISMQLHVAIPFEKDENELINLININFKSIFIFTGLLLFFYLLFNIHFFSILAIFLSTITAITNSLRSLIVWSGDFKLLSISYIIRALVIVVAQAIFSFIESINGLFYGLLLGEIIYSGLLHYFIRISGNLPNISLRSLYGASIKNVFTKYRAFTLYGSILELTSVLIFYGPIIIFSYLFHGNNNLIGQYSFISRLIWPPIILVSTSCANALYFHITKISYFELKSLTLRATLLSIILMFFSPLCAWIGQYVIDLLIKKSTWNLVSAFSFYIIIVALAFIASIYVRVIIRFKKLQRYQLIVDIIFLFIIGLMIFYQKGSNINNGLEILKFYTVLYSLYIMVLIFFVTFFIYLDKKFKVGESGGGNVS